MNADQLRLFLTITRHRSLSRAAVELGLGQATVSERLRALEAEVGTPLFERQGRGVALTPAGESFGPYAERVLEMLREAAEAARAAAGGQRGHVTVAVTVTAGAYLFAPALVAFQASHPQVQVGVRSVHSWDAPGVVLDGLAQLALISGPAVHPQIESVAVFRKPMLLAAGPQHPLAALAADGVGPQQLAAAQMLVSYWGPASRRFLDQVHAAGEAAGQIGQWMELSPVELVKGILLTGVGISLVPEIAVRRELEAGRLVGLPLASDSGLRLPEWEITLIRPRRRPPNAAADSLADTLARVLPTLDH
jgi:DNA-binding transcriptional LysR family regulator